jgi:hypothetical protein
MKSFLYVVHDPVACGFTNVDNLNKICKWTVMDHV